MNSLDQNSSENTPSEKFTFVDAAAGAKLKAGARSEDLIHASFQIEANKAALLETPTPQPDSHRVIAYQFIPLLANDGKSVTQAVALLHASGGWSVTELIDYPNREGGDYNLPDLLAEHLLKVTALRIITPPPTGFEINLRVLHRIFLKPTHPARGTILPPQGTCSSCGTAHSENHPHRNQRASRAIENRLGRYRVIDNRDPNAADWVCFACQGVADANGLSWPFEPWCTTIESDGSVNGRGGVISAFALNGLSRGEGRAWLKKLGYAKGTESRFPYAWKRPE